MERMEVDGLIINFQSNINKLKDMSINKANDKNDIYGVQMSYGKALENNLINALQFRSKNERIIIQKCTRDMDVLFGADFKIHFLDGKTDNFSMYVDVSASLEGLKYNIKYNHGERLMKLDNGLDVYIGIKLSHAGLFNYKKPVIVLYLDDEKDNAKPLFSEDSVNKIVTILKRVCSFITYKRIAAIPVGVDNKFASNIIELNHNKFIAQKILERCD